MSEFKMLIAFIGTCLAITFCVEFGFVLIKELYARHRRASYARVSRLDGDKNVD